MCYHGQLPILDCQYLPAAVPNCDLHCHSTCSDGLLSAPEVARRAAANGVDMLALTDHDALDGLPGARAAANDVGMAFVNGVEISIEWEALQIHILGFAFDLGDQTLNAGLASVRSGRIERARQMLSLIHI